ncbi:MAG TPA: hypothetical protein VNO24_20235 [Blastocatellia bacterium]|nr:hypothetical protein [Blastocatellia bacterium]
MPTFLIVILNLVMRFNLEFFLVGFALVLWRQGVFGSGRRPPSWIGWPIFICYTAVAIANTVGFMVNPTKIVNGIFAGLWIYFAVQAWRQR